MEAYQPRTTRGGAVFVTRTGKRQTVSNVEHRRKTTIRAANRKLSRNGIESISERVTPHSLRRTSASLRAALHDDPVMIAEQVGHTDPTFTLKMYARASKRREKLSGAFLAAFDQALEWAQIGTNGDAIPAPGVGADSESMQGAASQSDN